MLDVVLPEKLDAESQPHPDFGGWHNFIRGYTELRDKYDGVYFFRAANCNYVVFPSGLLVQNYGFHGQSLMDTLRDRGVSYVETQVRKARAELSATVSELFAQERKTANDLCDWLLTCVACAGDAGSSCRIESAVPVRISFGPRNRRRQTQPSWFGALYCERHACLPTERVVTDGPMRAGEITRSYRLYLLGDLSDRLRQGKKWVMVYDLPDDRRQPIERCYGPSNEWYLTFYCQDKKNISPQQRLYSPFGRMFALTLHQSMNFGYYKDWKIDTGERTTYARIPMTVEYLSPAGSGKGTSPRGS